MYFDDNKHVIITEPRRVCLDLSKNSLKYEISSIVKRNEFLVKQKIKHVVIQNLSSYCTWKDIRQQYKFKQFLFSAKYSRLFLVHHKKHKHYPLILILVFISTEALRLVLK